jgi:hypothetical protein
VEVVVLVCWLQKTKNLRKIQNLCSGLKALATTKQIEHNLMSYKEREEKL